MSIRLTHYPEQVLQGGHFQNRPGALRRLIAVLAIETREQNGDNAQPDRRKNTGLWPDLASREPCISAERGIQKIVVRRDAAVGNSVEERLAPIPSGVKPDRPPEIS